MSEEADNFTNLSAGEILRRVRMQHKLSLSQVEADTRIKSIYLEALEVGDFERLPGQVYVTGFVKVYSDYLGLDSDKMVQLLKKQTGHKISRPVNIFPVVDDDQKIPNLKIVLISGALLFLILLGWSIAHPGLRDEEIPGVPKELSQQLIAPQKPPETKVEAAAAEASKPKPHPVVLKAVQDVWLEIHDGAGKPIFSRVLKQGEEYWVPEDALNYRMTTGNAGGLEMVIEGELLKSMGKTGEVRRNISLNPADLKALSTPSAPAVQAKPKLD